MFGRRRGGGEEVAGGTRDGAQDLGTHAVSEGSQINLQFPFFYESRVENLVRMPVVERMT